MNRWTSKWDHVSQRSGTASITANPVAGSYEVLQVSRKNKFRIGLALGACVLAILLTRLNHSDDRSAKLGVLIASVPSSDLKETVTLLQKLRCGFDISGSIVFGITVKQADVAGVETNLSLFPKSFQESCRHPKS